jgi:hypothetical protein
MGMYALPYSNLLGFGGAEVTPLWKDDVKTKAQKPHLMRSAVTGNIIF